MALPQPKIVYIGNSLVLELGDDQGDGLQDAITKAWINDATVTATLKTTAGIDLAGQAWPLALPYVAGSRGVYRGVLEPALVITDKQSLVLFADVSRSGTVAHLEIPMVGAIRKK